MKRTAMPLGQTALRCELMQCSFSWRVANMTKISSVGTAAAALIGVLSFIGKKLLMTNKRKRAANMTLIMMAAK